MTGCRGHIVRAGFLLLTSGGVRHANGQFMCDEAVVARAESQYRFGWFGQALETLQPCLLDEVHDTRVQASAYRLAALSYIADDSPERAREITARLLDVEPGYQPDPESDNLVFQGMVDDLKPRWYTWFWRGNEWYKWTVRGAVASGVVMAPILLQGDEAPDLPEAPPDPQ